MCKICGNGVDNRRKSCVKSLVAFVDFSTAYCQPMENLGLWHNSSITRAQNYPQSIQPTLPLFEQFLYPVSTTPIIY